MSRRRADTIFPAGSVHGTGSSIYIIGNESDRDLKKMNYQEATSHANAMNENSREYPRINEVIKIFVYSPRYLMPLLKDISFHVIDPLI